MRLGALALGLLAMAALARPATAQDYPNKPVTVILPLAAGSGLDLVVP
jgi:tripartite-type tricarboxylate transporter receptor subunit TctC